MRILVVVHGYPPQAQGGSEMYAHAQARVLARDYEDDVLVLTREQDRTRAEYAVRHETRDGVRIAWINNTFLSTRTFTETYCNSAIGSIAESLIDEFRPDVAHVHHLTCLSTTIVPALAKREIPCFFTLHDYWLMCHRGQLLDLDLHVCAGPDATGCCQRCLGPVAGAPPAAFLAARVMRSIERTLPRAIGVGLRRAAVGLSSAIDDRELEESESRRRTEHMRRICVDVTRFLAPSEHIREQFVRFGITRERITDAPYGVDHASFDGRPKFRRDDGPTTERAKPPFSRPLRLGFLGSLMVSKAPHVLLEATRTLDAGAVTVDLFGDHIAYHGDDSYRQQLAPLLARNGVHDHGRLAHDRVPKALASIDVLVVPSVWPENSPLVIHEAYLAGVPVIASRIGGIPELVKEGKNGLLFEPGDVDGLRQAIVRLVEEPGLLDDLRAGIEPVRTIEADVAFTRGLYATHAPAGAKTGGNDHGRTSAERVSRLAAVVLNYRTPDQTLLSVRSLTASRRVLDEIIVVDNDDAHGGVPHSDCHHEADYERMDGIAILRTGKNLGFSGGVNTGIRAALDRGADAILLVNSDVIVPPDCVGRLEQALQDAPSAGIAGPVVAARSAPGRVASLGISYNPSTGRMRHQGVGDTMRDERPARAMVDAVSGCLVLITRAVFEEVGLFDEDYFFSFEDLDFCLRARRAGFETILVGGATAYHEGGQSIGATPQRLYFAARNHLLMANRTTPVRSRGAHACRFSNIVMLNLAHALIAPGGSLPQRVAAVLSGTRDYLAGRYGMGRAFEAAASDSAGLERARRSS